MEYATSTDIGPREINQDRIVAKVGQVVTESNHLMPCGLFCVADGMGGLEDGEYAATVAVELIENWWNEAVANNHPIGTAVLDSFFTLFKNINDTIRKNSEEAKSGTTCSVLMIQGRNYYIAHVGDSRIYQIDKKFFMPKLQLLTEDHSIGNRLTSCLGAFAKPKIFTHSGIISKNCTFLLCSDGLHGAVSSKQLVTLSNQLKTCNELAGKLVATALEQGTNDNVSVVVVRV